MRAAALLLLAALAGCATIVPAPPAATPPQLFFERLSALCGGAYVGRVVSTDPADREMAASRLVVEVRECSEREVRIAYPCRQRPQPRLDRHAHPGGAAAQAHPPPPGRDRGCAQPLWRRQRRGGRRRGGRTSPPTPSPATSSCARAFRNRSPTSGRWNSSPGRRLAYALRRPNRNFRVEFDLTRPIANPPRALGRALSYKVDA